MNIHYVYIDTAYEYYIDTTVQITYKKSSGFLFQHLF